MNASQILPMLLGAALVALGIIAGAVADRIRGVRAARASSRSTSVERAKADIAGRTAELALRDDVIAALVQAGYPRSEATRGVAITPASQRSTLESWTRGALAQLRAS